MIIPSCWSGSASHFGDETRDAGFEQAKEGAEFRTQHKRAVTDVRKSSRCMLIAKADPEW